MHACIHHVSNCCVPINCCYLQAGITECNLLVTGLVDRGPGRLATQVTNPPTGLGFIHASQPFLSLSNRVSSSEVFVVDGVVVVFVGFSNGQVRKVCGVCMCMCVSFSLYIRCYLSVYCSWVASQISAVIAKPKGEASNHDVLSFCVGMYGYLYVCISVACAIDFYACVCVSAMLAQYNPVLARVYPLHLCNACATTRPKRARDNCGLSGGRFA